MKNINNVVTTSSHLQANLLDSFGLSFVLYIYNKQNESWKLTDIWNIDFSDLNCSRSFNSANSNGMLNTLQNTNCQNSTLIKKALCDSSDLNDVHFIDAKFPYFSGINVSFSDEYCTDSFRNFIERNRHTIPKRNMADFLKDLNSCMRHIKFLDQYVYSYERQHGNGLLEIGNEVTEDNQVLFEFHSKSCMVKFLDFVHSYGHLVTGIREKHLISLRMMNDFTKKHGCVEVRLPCYGTPYKLIQFGIPRKSITYISIALTIIVITVNAFVVITFLQKKHRSPLTVLLSALAISDTFTAVMITSPDFIAHMFDYNHIVYFGEIYWHWYIFDYRKFLVVHTVESLTFTFHIVSVLITTWLCLLKSVSLQFPLWTKTHVNNKLCFGLSIAFSIYSLLLHVPLIASNFYITYDINGVPCIDLQSEIYKNHEQIAATVNSVIGITYLVAVILIITSTVYLSWKLIYHSKNISCTESELSQKKQHRSAVIVVIVCVIFILSEFISILETIAYITKLSNFYNNREVLFQVADISWILGFALNFFVYLVMGQLLRKKLINVVKRIIRYKGGKY
ncbi:unnamed protein product [Mytilus coruscus]|uniref:G-protein coupled receptors family 1 profile domain-containing protein n=1 Tax=Mytilus coruscus TaxID=42192 RepID=A0A6J8CM35_MYTCO|nr:unnamed protein product [Mytilus coruscus]